MFALFLKRNPVSSPFFVNAAATVPKRSLAADEAVRCSARSSIHLTGAPVLRLTAARRTMYERTACLIPKPPAAARRRDKAQPVARHAQCAGHERLDHERPLEVRPHRVTVGCAFEVRNDAERLHRRGGIARVRVGELENPVSRGKGSVRVAVNEATLVYDV